MLPQRSSPYPARKRSALATHSLLRVGPSEMTIRLDRALRRPTTLSLASPLQSLRARLRPTQLRQSGIAIQALGAARSAPPLHHPQSESSSSPLLASRQSNYKSSAATVRHGTLPGKLSATLGHAPRHNRQPKPGSLRFSGEKRLKNFLATRSGNSRPIVFHTDHAPVAVQRQ